MRNINNGVYPTMITPFIADGKVDYQAAEKLVEWYWKHNCDGIFASCQSSEIWFLPLEDRVKLAKTVKDKADSLASEYPEHKKMSIVASGHVSDSFEDQVRELKMIAETGVDSVVLISNRMDIENTSDDRWIADTKKLIEALPENITFGVYECPKPYKRLLTFKMIEWLKQTGRFSFIKDTCCDADIIAERMKQLSGTPIQLFNANTQTLLKSLQLGAHGYCGIMANMHPQMYVWLCDNFRNQTENAEYVQALLSVCSFVESGLAYPVIAKYHLKEFEGIDMSMFTLSRNPAELTDYQKDCVGQMNHLIRKAASLLQI